MKIKLKTASKKGTGKVGSERKRLGIETWVEKCTFFDNTTIYCGIPQDPAAQSGLDHNLNTSPDDLYAIDVNTGRSTLIASPVLDLQMFNLYVTDDDSVLYFTDEQGRLQKIQLK